MSVRVQRAVLKASFWLASEVLLTLIGLDNLADYSEFVFQDRSGLSSIETTIICNHSV